MRMLVVFCSMAMLPVLYYGVVIWQKLRKTINVQPNGRLCRITINVKLNSVEHSL